MGIHSDVPQRIFLPLNNVDRGRAFALPVSSNRVSGFQCLHQPLVERLALAPLEDLRNPIEHVFAGETVALHRKIMMFLSAGPGDALLPSPGGSAPVSVDHGKLPGLGTGILARKNVPNLSCAAALLQEPDPVYTEIGVQARLRRHRSDTALRVSKELADCWNGRRSSYAKRAGLRAAGNNGKRHQSALSGSVLDRDWKGVGKLDLALFTSALPHLPEPSITFPGSVRLEKHLRHLNDDTVRDAAGSMGGYLAREARSSAE